VYGIGRGVVKGVTRLQVYGIGRGVVKGVTRLQAFGIERALSKELPDSKFAAWEGSIVFGD
jgi:hypothetical protein